MGTVEASFEMSWKIEPTPEKLCEWVTENAFDFLETSIKEVEEKPKYSVIHFCAGMELFFKARLMKEHWSLIVEESDNADWQKFISGECATVNFRKLFTRIANIAPEKEKKYFSTLANDKEKKQVFNALANHRNQILHFYHSKLAQDTDNGKIVQEQCRAWHQLQRLLIVQWKEHFSGIEGKIATLNKAMKQYNPYLKVIYENEYKTEIEQDIKQGVRYVECPICENLSAKVDIIWEDHKILQKLCSVCDYESDYYIEFQCFNCSNFATYGPDGGGCQCGKMYDIEEVKRVFHTDSEYYCSLCKDSKKSVIYYKDFYICLNCCLHEKQITTCEQCEEKYLDLDYDCPICSTSKMTKFA